ncbi:GNAT family N-acetyltransferase [Halopelagius longus]|uniref:N-acetyltransferase n=1 Tax=Halopelagius longus TaxID=1236180 RepID=A0A370IR41_9EURY|nr:GNAT family protein [Halopelagius longus]RDI73136.1 N-acetyltransferase [Halopelagius longus]
MSDLFPAAVETSRLRLERVGHEAIGVRELYGVVSSDDGIEDVTEHAPWSPHENPKETAEFLERCEKQFRDGENADYVIRLREGEEGAGEFAGMCGLNCEWDRDSAELGVWLRKRFWGRGYSGERARALMRLAFERLDFGLVAVGAAAENDRSRRAVEKYVESAGGRFEGVVRHGLAFADGSVRDEARYSVSREEWCGSDAERSSASVRFFDSLDGD